MSYIRMDRQNLEYYTVMKKHDLSGHEKTWISLSDIAK